MSNRNAVRQLVNLPLAARPLVDLLEGMKGSYATLYLLEAVMTDDINVEKLIRGIKTEMRRRRRDVGSRG